MKMKWDCKGYYAQAKEIFDDEAFTMLIENDCNPLTTHALFVCSYKYYLCRSHVCHTDGLVPS